jgi:hypothetical protein
LSLLKNCLNNLQIILMSETHFKYDETLNLSKAAGEDPGMRQILEKILIFVKKKDKIDLSKLETTVQNLNKKLDGMSEDISKIYKKLEDYEEPEDKTPELPELPELEDRTISFDSPLTDQVPTQVPAIGNDDLVIDLVEDDIHDHLAAELAKEMEEAEVKTIETPATSLKKYKAKKKVETKHVRKKKE